MAVFIKDKMNLLFVCSANKNRSKTAEDYFQTKYPNFKVLSAGTNRKACDKEGSTFLTEELLEWADIIFVMEEKHKNIILENALTNVAYKMKVLNIEDIYSYNQPELIEMLDRKTCGFQARVSGNIRDFTPPKPTKLVSESMLEAIIKEEYEKIINEKKGSSK